MSLTYQPFAEEPQITRLVRDLRMNVGETERTLSVVVGAALISAGLGRTGLLRLALIALGVGLVRRWWTGQCALYERVGIDGRHDKHAAPNDHGDTVRDFV